jgi:hypothetical protein
MGHNVTGLIAIGSLLERFSIDHGLHPPVALTAGLAILALSDEDLDLLVSNSNSGHVEGFTHLSEQLTRVLQTASATTPIMYFETDYFGGVGLQGAAVFRGADTLYGPEVAEIGPINGALRTLGVQVRAPARDEFDTVGLQRHRHTEEWIMSDGLRDE